MTRDQLVSAAIVCGLVAAWMGAAAAAEDEVDRALAEVRDTKADMFSRRSSVLGELPGPAELATASKFQFCANIDALSENSPPPLRADAEGRYPVPIPGVWSEI